MVVKINHTYTEALTEQLAQGKVAIHTVVFRGKTTNTSKTELFVDGISGYRLQPPLGSTLYITKICLGIKTDGTPTTSTPENGTDIVQRSAADAITNTQGATHTICDVEVDNASGKKYITVSVTSAESATVYWEVVLRVTCLTLPEALVGTGAFDGVQK